MQLVVVFFSSVVIFIILGISVGIAGVFLAAVMEIPIIFFALKIRKENKKGNPSFLKSFIRFNSQKKQFADERNVLKYLITK